MKYKVIRDNREQTNNGWWFSESQNCDGTVKGTLKTGDYSLVGLESVLTIERKRSTGEFAQNICEKRFWRELDRLEGFAHPFLILEFDYTDLKRYPEGSGIPCNRWGHLKTNHNFLIKKFMDIELNYKTKVIFAPFNSQERASLIFKYVWSKYDAK